MTQQDADQPDGQFRRDRHEHGGSPQHIDDDRLAPLTEEERVAAGIDDYDPDEVPPATDAPPQQDVTETDEYQEARAAIRREFAHALRPLMHQPATPGPAAFVLVLVMHPAQLRCRRTGCRNSAEGDSDGRDGQPWRECGVAVLGTGIMGSAMARNLVSAGLRTMAWDLSPTATEPLSDAGALVTGISGRTFAGIIDAHRAWRRPPGQSRRAESVACIGYVDKGHHAEWRRMSRENARSAAVISSLEVKGGQSWRACIFGCCA